VFEADEAPVNTRTEPLPRLAPRADEMCTEAADSCALLPFSVIRPPETPEPLDSDASPALTPSTADATLPDLPVATSIDPPTPEEDAPLCTPTSPLLPAVAEPDATEMDPLLSWLLEEAKPTDAPAPLRRDTDAPATRSSPPALSALESPAEPKICE